MNPLLTLLALQRQAQDAKTRQEFLHVVVNQSKKLIEYRQAIFWNKTFLGVGLEKISGHAILDPKSPYALGVLEHLKCYKGNQVNPEIRIIEESSPNTVLTIIPFSTQQDGIIGGLILESDRKFRDEEQSLLQELALSYAPLLALHDLRRISGIGSRIKHLWGGNAKRNKVLLISLLVILFFPVRVSVTAPVEIVAKDADYLTAPFDGLVSDVFVHPGDEVEQGQKLVLLDDTVLKADADLASQTLDVAHSSLSRLRRESLAQPEKKAELSAVESDIEEKKIRADYAQVMLERSAIKSTRNGIAIFPAKESLEGHPVRAGDVLIKIANPKQYEALIRVPVEAMIAMDDKAQVDFFLNVYPSKSFDAQIISIGYESSVDEDGIYTYKISADITDNEQPLKIGWKGTAKIRTGWSVLSYEILRRPILMVRKLTGI
ncbi:MAG: HlyD family efflux transporter periplasmic adaptor subunit [Alphaproteobacteria bacterium]|nr:HlyD family efflux transporter periplasmic adaptor subunit [Alphaproteobacteria bacterium]